MSGLYLPGMEMPGSCCACPCSYDNQCAVTNQYPTFDEWYGDRPSWCPLVPVPPHGDLIDRKALVNNKYATFTIEEEGLRGVYRDKGVWLSAVENAPTIIPADKEEDNGN